MFKPILAALLVAAAILASSNSQAADGNRARKGALTPVAPGAIYVQFKPGSRAMQALAQKSPTIQSMTDARYDRVIRQLNVTLTEPFDSHCDSISRALGINRMYRIYYSNHAIDPQRAVEKLLATGEVQSASCQYLFPISMQPNDSRVGEQYALTRMNLFNAWDVTTGDSNIVIADVDCATNIDHEDLVKEIKYNSGEIGLDSAGHDKRTNGIDDDGDHYIDNWQGWDVVGTAPNGSPFRPDNNPRPDNTTMNHGTLTAGCILATGNNGKGVAGVAWGCRLLPIKASSNAQYINGGYEGIHYAVNHGANVVNCSWGGPITSAGLDYANVFLKEAIARNVLVVCASGNEGSNLDVYPSYPANGPGVLSVGATTSTDAAANFGNYGHSVGVFAPGAGILSTDYPGNSAYNTEDGTSFSSPLTAGVAALVFSQHPTWTPQFVARQVIQTCDNVVNPTNNYYFWGRVNAGAAVSTQAWAGFVVSNWTLDGKPNDSLDYPGTQQQLKVSIKNLIAPGTNVIARLVTNPGYTAVSGPQTLSTVAENASADLTFTISRTDQYTFGLLPVKIYMSDGGRLSDTLTVSIPMKRIAGFRTIDRPKYGSSIKRVDNTTAWASFGTEVATQSGNLVVSEYAAEFSGDWDPTSPLDDSSIAPYCVEATDLNHAWFGTGSAASQANVISTDDAGGSFTVTDVTTITPFVNSIHFFDANNGIFIGDPKSSRWGIALTTNGGSSWSKLAKLVSAPASEASWNNSACWVGQNGWFGTNKNHIWHTTDAGQTWKSTAVPQPNSLGIGFAPDALHGFACCRPAAQTGTTTLTGVNAILYTADGGATWSEIARPDTMSPGDVRFIPDTNIAIFTSSSGVYQTSDYGSTWSRLPIPLEFDAEGAYLDISRNNDSVVISVLSSTVGIAQYSMPFVAPTRSVADGDRTVGLSITNAPNPVALTTAITYTHSRNEHIKLAMYDVLGREVAKLVDGERVAGTETVRFNTSSLADGTYYYVLETASGERLTRALSVAH